VIGAIEVHPRLSRLGFPFDPLTPLSGRPLLARTVEAALRCPALDALLVLAPAAEAAGLESALSGLGLPAAPARGAGARGARRGKKDRVEPRLRVVACEGEDIRARDRVRRLRRLAPSSWRAGWAIPYAVAEAGNPHWLLAAMARSRAERIMLFPQAAPFLDPDLIGEAIAGAEAHRGPLARLSTAPPGIAGDILDHRLVAEAGRMGVPVDLPMRFYPDQAERMLENKQVFHWFSVEVSGFGTRLSAESRRALAVLAGVERALGDQGPGAGPPGSWLRRLSDRPDVLAGPIPPEVSVQVTTRRRTECVFDAPPPPAGPQGGPDMEPALFDRLARQLGAWQECRLVISGGEPLLHPEIGSILDRARQSGVGVVEVETDGRGLDARALDLLALADVVRVAVDAAVPATYRALKGVDALAEVEGGIERLLERSAAAGGWPVVALEFRLSAENEGEAERFFDRWFPRTPFVVVGSPSDRAGQLAARAVHPARTPQRIPCLKLLESLHVLPDGRAAACRNDFHGLAPVGDLRENSVEEVWTGPALAELRQVHARRAWDERPLCAKCGDWCRR
jgi:iron-sulfur cluster protein